MPLPCFDIALSGSPADAYDVVRVCRTPQLAPAEQQPPPHVGVDSNNHLQAVRPGDYSANAAKLCTSRLASYWCIKQLAKQLMVETDLHML